jgi:hypothetical protein
MYRRKGACEKLRGVVARLLAPPGEDSHDWRVEILFAMNPEFHAMNNSWQAAPFFNECNFEPFTEATPDAAAASEKVTP